MPATHTTRLAPLARTLAALALIAPPAAADTAAPGYELEVLPGGGPYLTATLSSGEFIGLGNSTVARFAEDGTLLEELHDFGNFVGPSGIEIDPTETYALVCRDDGSITGTYRVDLTGGPTTFVTFFAASSLVIEPAGSILMSLTDGYSSWTIYRIDQNTGQASQKGVSFTGTNVSIDMDSSGNLYVAYEYLTSGYVERFDAGQVAGPGLFQLGDGTIVADQLERPFGLAVSSDGRNYYTVDTEFFSDSHLVQLGKGGRRVLARIDQTGFVFHLDLESATPSAQVVGGPRLPGAVIYQGKINGSWQRYQLTVEGSAGTPGPVFERGRE